MKQFISETQDLVFREFTVSATIYENMVDRFGSEEEAMNALEYQIQKRMRDYRQACSKVRKVKVQVAFHPIIEKLFLDYSSTYALNFNEAIERIMKCTKRR